MKNCRRFFSKGSVLVLALTVGLIAVPAFGQDIEGDTLTITGNATVGGALGVTGGTTTNGIANTGDVATDTLSAAGAATVGGALDVSGAATLGNTLTVEGAATLNGATAVNNTLGVSGATTLGNTLTVEGAATLNGATAVNNTLLVDSNGAAAGGGRLDVNDTGVSLTYAEGAGKAHGLTIGPKSTTLSGGASTTSMTLDDKGVTFFDSAGGPVRVTGVADGMGPTDAVNRRQLDSLADKAYGGIAAVAALSAIPDAAPGKNFTVGLGYGYYSSQSAVALGLKGRLMDNLSFSAGVGYNDGRLTPAVGVGFSW